MCCGNPIGFALGIQIRKLTYNKKSLDNLTRQMYCEFGMTGKKYTLDDIIRIINEISGEDFQEFFDKYVSGRERLPLEEYFSDVGLQVKIQGGTDEESRTEKEMDVTITTKKDATDLQRAILSGIRHG